MSDKKKNLKISFICWTIASICYLLSFIIDLVTNNFKTLDIMNISLSVCFGCLAITSYQNYKKEK